MADLSETVGTIAGVGVALWGLNAVSNQLKAGMPRQRRAKKRKTGKKKKK